MTYVSLQLAIESSMLCSSAGRLFQCSLLLGDRTAMGRRSVQSEGWDGLSQLSHFSSCRLSAGVLCCVVAWSSVVY